jgi:hypothetical protein
LPRGPDEKSDEALNRVNHKEATESEGYGIVYISRLVDEMMFGF